MGHLAQEMLKGTAATLVGAAAVDATALDAAPAAAASAGGCTAPAGGDFPKVGGNLGNQNYTSLAGIRRDNIKRLRAAWVNRIEGGLTTGNRRPEREPGQMEEADAVRAGARQRHPDHRR